MAESWCRVCGKMYNACPHCDPSKSWRVICDTEPHFQVWVNTYEFQIGVRPKEEAKACLNNLLKYKRITLDEVETFIPAVRDIFHKIMDMPVEAEVTSSSDVKDETPVKPVVKKTSNRKGRA